MASEVITCCLFACLAGFGGLNVAQPGIKFCGRAETICIALLFWTRKLGSLVPSLGSKQCKVLMRHHLTLSKILGEHAAENMYSSMEYLGIEGLRGLSVDVLLRILRAFSSNKLTHTHTHTHTHTRAYIYICTHTHTHRHTQTKTHTNKLASRSNKSKLTTNTHTLFSFDPPLALFILEKAEVKTHTLTRTHTPHTLSYTQPSTHTDALTNIHSLFNTPLQHVPIAGHAMADEIVASIPCEEDSTVPKKQVSTSLRGRSRYDSK